MTGGSEAAPRVARAWACLGANALILPGLGSLAAGLWISGMLQVLSALAGFVLTMSWALAWLGSALEQGALPTDLGPNLERGAAGLLLFGLSWLWAIASGVRLVRRARDGRAPD